MKGYTGETRLIDKKILAVCTIAALIAGLSPIITGVGLVYISVLIGICAFGALLVFRYHWAVILNILILSFVKFEPAPADLVFILLFAVGVMSHRLESHRLNPTRPMILFPILYILISTLQLFISHEMMLGIRYHLITMYLIAYSYYMFLYVSRDNIKNIIRAYIISGTISALLGLAGYLGVLPSLLMYDRYRAMALFKDPNVFGPFLVPVVVMLIEDSWKKQLFDHPSWIRIIHIAINLLGIIVSSSRGAWVNTCACLLIYFVLNIKKIHLPAAELKRLVLYALLVLVIVSVVWRFIIPHEYKQFLLSRINFQTYDKDRFATHRKGIALASINIFGFGPGQFEYNVLRYSGAEFSAHNLYIRLAMENGLIGLLLFIGSLAFIIYELGIHHLQGRTYIVMTPASLVAILMGIMVNGIVIDTIHWRHFWFFIGIGMAAITMNHKHNPDSTSVGPPSIK